MLILIVDMEVSVFQYCMVHVLLCILMMAMEGFLVNSILVVSEIGDFCPRIKVQIVKCMLTNTSCTCRFNRGHGSIVRDCSLARQETPVLCD